MGVQAGIKKGEGKVGGLTTQQRLFVKNFSGNAEDAARIAGFSSPANYAARLIQNPKIIEAIRARGLEIEDDIEEHGEGTIMGRTEILERLSTIARGKWTNTSDRLKALEMLGKAIALWVTKVESDSGLTYEERLRMIIAQEEAEAALAEYGDL